MSRHLSIHQEPGRRKRKAFVRWAGLAMCSFAGLTGTHSTANAAEIVKAKKTGFSHMDFKSDWRSDIPLRDESPIIRSSYPWHREIVTTTFWIGEKPSGHNPVPNRKSCWDVNWVKNYGGTDSPQRERRASNFAPLGFAPQQNPFYIALPYNDMTSKGHKPGAESVIPWFRNDFQSPSQSVCKGRWVAIRRGERVCYAQWEDAGPFRTDHSDYVFGMERPMKNINKGAGLDVSPAVRDFLGMDSTDMTDWKFVDFAGVPAGPWAVFGNNNTFVINRRLEEGEARLALLTKQPAMRTRAVE